MHPRVERSEPFKTVGASGSFSVPLCLCGMFWCFPLRTSLLPKLKGPVNPSRRSFLASSPAESMAPLMP